jgi:hypothetical protein
MYFCRMKYKTIIGIIEIIYAAKARPRWVENCEIKEYCSKVSVLNLVL